jgi:hypothetical protein
VVRTGYFEKLLEMIFGWPSLVLEVMFGGRYTLLILVTDSLVVTTVVGYCGDVMGSLLLPLVAALSAFPGALDGILGGCSSATISVHFRIA